MQRNMRFSPYTMSPFRRKGLGQTSTLAAAIARQEGFGISGAVATRNNNPGNLSSPPSGQWAGQTGVDSSGFAVFDNSTDGWSALNKDIAANSGLTLTQFLNKYAPPSQNNTGAYISNVSSWTGASPTDTIADIVAGNTSATSTATPDTSDSDSSVSSGATAGFDLTSWWQSVADSVGIDATTLGIGAAVVGLGVMYMAVRE